MVLFLLLVLCKRIFHRLRKINSIFFALICPVLGICIPNASIMSTIKCFYFLYTSSKNLSIAGAMQRFFSSFKETKIYFLSTHSTYVRDRTACLNSFCVVAYIPIKYIDVIY